MLTRPLYIKKVYQTQQTLHRCQDREKDEVTPHNMNIIHVNITCLFKVTPLNIKSIRGNIKGLRSYLNIGESNCEKAYCLYLNIIKSNRKKHNVSTVNPCDSTRFNANSLYTDVKTEKKDEVTPHNMNIIHVNITCLFKVTPLNIKSIRGNIKGLRSYLNIGESNCEKAYCLYLNIIKSNRKKHNVSTVNPCDSTRFNANSDNQIKSQEIGQG